MNKIEQVPSLGHQMSLVGVGWGQCWWGSRVCGVSAEGSMYGEVQCIMDNGHIVATRNVDRMID